MAYAFPSLLTRHTLRSGVHNSFPQLKQLFPRHETFSGALKTTPHSLQRCFHSSQSSVIRAVREIGPKEKGGITFWLQGATIAGVGLSLANLRSPVVHCDGEHVPRPIRRVLTFSSARTTSQIRTIYVSR